MALEGICPECGPHCHDEPTADPAERTWSQVVYGLTSSRADVLAGMGFASDEEALDWARNNWLAEFKTGKHAHRYVNEKPPADMDVWLADMRQRCG